MEVNKDMLCPKHNFEYNYYCFDCPSSKKFLCDSCHDDHGKVHGQNTEDPHNCDIFKKQARKVKLQNESVGLESVEGKIRRHFDGRKGELGKVLADLKDSRKPKGILEDLKDIKKRLNEILTKSILSSVEPISSLEDLHLETTEKEFNAKASIRRYKELSEDFNSQEDSTLYQAFRNYSELESLKKFFRDWKEEEGVSFRELCIHKEKALAARKDLVDKLTKATKKYYNILSSILSNMGDPEREFMVDGLIEKNEDEKKDVRREVMSNVDNQSNKEYQEYSEKPNKLTNFHGSEEVRDVSIQFGDNYFSGYYFWYATKKALCVYRNHSNECYYIPVHLSTSETEDSAVFSDKSESVLIKNSLFICGGGNDYEVFSSTYVVTFESPIATSAEAKKTVNMKAGRMEHSLVVLEGKILAIGGKTNEDMLSSVECFDKSSWKSIEDLPKKLYGMATCVFKSKVYVFAGSSGKKSPSLRVYMFSFKNGWAKLPELPSKSFQHIAVAVSYGDHIMLLGGKLENKCCLYNPETNVSEIKEELKLPDTDKDCKRGSGMVIRNQIYVQTKSEGVSSICKLEGWSIRW
eukprot:TRINITY_DN9108_c0_g1_i5.p1 TRINITY_DN9108_c0_g1~~TRINITY_DN9108_c0_g1_i5.p1  ORF type:complete len:578 (-),score=207.60 TRINITY_DN9108_c0_g1_i5:523-2256(-)